MPTDASCNSQQTSAGIEISVTWPMTGDPELLAELSTHVLLTLDDRAQRDFANASPGEQGQALAYFDSFLGWKIKALLVPKNTGRHIRPMYELSGGPL